MKRALRAWLLILTTVDGYSAASKNWIPFTATAYSVAGETASGKQTRAGRTVAADPDVLPLGTHIEVRGAGAYSGTYIVQDVGRKIAGRKIDIFIDAPVAAKKFGRKQVRVRVLKAKPVSQTRR